MNKGKNKKSMMLLLATIIAFSLVSAGFYGLDHLVMGIQGLPLNMDLTPVQ